MVLFGIPCFVFMASSPLALMFFAYGLVYSVGLSAAQLSGCAPGLRLCAGLFPVLTDAEQSTTLGVFDDDRFPARLKEGTVFSTTSPLCRLSARCAP